MADLRIIKPVMARQQHTATHYTVALRVTILCYFAWHVLKARLAKYIASKYRTRLYIPFLQEYLQVAADERRTLTDGGGIRQPAGT